MALQISDLDYSVYKNADIKKLCVLGIKGYQLVNKTIKRFSSQYNNISILNSTLGYFTLIPDDSMLFSTGIKSGRQLLNHSYTENVNKVVLIGGDSVSFFVYFVKNNLKPFELLVIPPKSAIHRFSKSGVIGFHACALSLRYNGSYFTTGENYDYIR